MGVDTSVPPQKGCLGAGTHWLPKTAPSAGLAGPLTLSAVQTGSLDFIRINNAFCEAGRLNGGCIPDLGVFKPFSVAFQTRS